MTRALAAAWMSRAIAVVGWGAAQVVARAAVTPRRRATAKARPSDSQTAECPYRGGIEITLGRDRSDRRLGIDELGIFPPGRGRQGAAQARVVGVEHGPQRGDALGVGARERDEAHEIDPRR